MTQENLGTITEILQEIQEDPGTTLNKPGIYQSLDSDTYFSIITPCSLKHSIIISVLACWQEDFCYVISMTNLLVPLYIIYSLLFFSMSK